MNKITIYLLAFLISFPGMVTRAQNNNQQYIISNELNDQIFYHTIERGQTVYSIATMYGVTVDDIYRLNPQSREGIKAGEQLRIPQRETLSPPVSSQEESYHYHTIQPRETLYSLTIRYEVPATAIVKANPGLSVETFTIGRTIRIPTQKIEEMPVSEFTNVTRIIEYTVPRRETMYRITRRFNISSEELIRLNPELKEGVKAGMVLKIPVQTDEEVTRQQAAPRERDVNALLSTPRTIDRVNMTRVALLLPFLTNDPVPSPNTPRFVEYYEGLLLAVDSIRNMGGSIELSVYDTGNGTDKLNSIFREENVRNAHLIIGAVQNEQITPVAQFALENNIKYVIPFTSRNDDVLSNANIFQVNTPQSYLYAKAVQAACDMFANDNIIIINIPDKDDKADYIKALKSEFQQRNIPYKELTHQENTFTHDVTNLLDAGQRNVIIPTSGTLEALNKFRSSLRTIMETQSDYNNKITLYGYPEWQTYTNETLEDFYALDTYIYTNFYADNLDKRVLDFYSKFKTWYSKTLINTYPKYGVLGFDTGMFFFEAINRYGSNFENNLDKIRYPSLQTGFDFERVNNWGGFINTHIFIVHYNKYDYSISRTEIK